MVIKLNEQLFKTCTSDVIAYSGTEGAALYQSRPSSDESEGPYAAKSRVKDANYMYLIGCLI
jgi:hypothetical protein